MARLWAKTTTFESVSVGDELPIVVKWETAETIERFLAFVFPRDEENAEQVENCADTFTDTFTDIATDAASQALVSYVTELLEKGFPFESTIARGSSLALELFFAVKPEDTISISGKVVEKEQVDGLSLVRCQVLIENQDNKLVAEATATVSL